MGRSREEKERFERKLNPAQIMQKYGQSPPLVRLARPCDNYADSFVPFICGNCGRNYELHPDIGHPSMLPYKEAIWKWLMKYGGVANYYGGYSSASAVIRHHMDNCEVDTDISSGPIMDYKMQSFAGTFDDDQYEQVISASLSCCCGQIADEKWTVRQTMSLGELIFQVIQEGLV